MDTSVYSLHLPFMLGRNPSKTQLFVSSIPTYCPLKALTYNYQEICILHSKLPNLSTIDVKCFANSYFSALPNDLR